MVKREWNAYVALFGGLALYGFSMALMVRGALGLNPWDVLHEGVSAAAGISFGAVTAATGVAVLLLWVPLGQRPGFGTLANVVVIAVSVDASLAVLRWALPTPPPGALAVALASSGIVLNALATVLYLGAGMGPGPRDGLMTGLVARTGLSVRLVRSGIEVAVLGAGWLLGGTVGLGTVVYALGVGPLVQWFARSPRLAPPGRWPGHRPVGTARVGGGAASAAPQLAG